MGFALRDGSTKAPRAYAVRRADAMETLTSDEMYGFAQQRLASYKALEGGIFFVESIPRTVSGKIQQRKLVKYTRLLWVPEP